MCLDGVWLMCTELSLTYHIQEKKDYTMFSNLTTLLNIQTAKTD